MMNDAFDSNRLVTLFCTRAFCCGVVLGCCQLQFGSCQAQRVHNHVQYLVLSESTVQVPTRNNH